VGTHKADIHDTLPVVDDDYQPVIIAFNIEDDRIVPIIFAKRKDWMIMYWI
jgi:hypothetical protein